MATWWRCWTSGSLILLLGACAHRPIDETPYDQLQGYELDILIQDLKLQMQTGDASEQRIAEAKYQVACSHYRERMGRSSSQCPPTPEEEDAQRELAKPVREPVKDPIAPCPIEEYVRREPRPDWEQSQADARVAFGAGDQRLLFRILCPAAAWEIPEAEYGLCMLRAKGAIGIERDLPSAEAWCRRSVAHGHLPAEELLATVLLEYQARRELQAEATELLQRAAERGSGRAAFELAGLLGVGRFTGRNLEEARRWALIARERGVPEAPQLVELIEAEIARQGPP